ncbi:MAG TPA: VOC family protein [Solirubrobacterales bacterium]|nr:VOC family protein [Solirubrobacterales bacterium]
MAVTLDELTIADSPRAWRDCGFEVRDDCCVLGEVKVRLDPEQEGRGIVGWALRGVESLELDGLPTLRADELRQGDTPPPDPPPPDPPPDKTSSRPAPAHPNGVTSIDHVVAISPDLDRTVAALVAAGLDLRRVREEPTPAGAPRQAFFRLGGTILEVVQEPPEATERAGGDRPAFFWGLALTAPDLDATVAFLGERAGEPRAAVQPGRRIATLRRGAGLSLPVALMTPPPVGR